MCPFACIHTQPFYGSQDFVWDNLGEQVPEETFTHSHLSYIYEKCQVVLNRGNSAMLVFDNTSRPAAMLLLIVRLEVGVNDIKYKRLGLSPL